MSKNHEKLNVPWKDKGFMYVAGKFNQEKHYKSSLNDKRGIQRKFFRKIYHLFCKNGFGKVAKDMQKEVRKRNLPTLPGKDQYFLFSDFVVMSVNYYNNNHVDVRDGHGCVTIWTHKNGNSHGIKKAYIVFPDVKITYWDDSEGKEVTKAFAIPLEHGMTVEWDGQILRNCTTVIEVEPGSDNEIYGAFFCLKNVTVN